MKQKLDTAKFKTVGGDPSLDFINTVGARAGHPDRQSGPDYKDFFEVDKLETYADLAAWSLKAGILGERQVKNLLLVAEKNPADAKKVLSRARRLRNGLYRLFKAAAERWRSDEDDLKVLNQEMELARRHQKLVSDSPSSFNFEWENAENSLDAMLWPVAVSAAKLLSEGDLTRIRQCGSSNCNWLFYDSSRNRSRQWCDMRDCGNLAKVRRFRAKNS